MPAVRTVYIELRASAEKLRADMVAAKTSVAEIGKSGEESGQRMAHGMDQASISVRKVAGEATEVVLAMTGAYRTFTSAVRVYGVAAATAGGSTEELVTGLRALRIAASVAFPATFGSVGLAATTVALGVLAEGTIRLVNARAKLIDQQSLIAATSGLSFSSVERLDAVSKISGGDGDSARNLASVLASRMESNRTAMNLGLGALGLSADDPDLLRKIAAGFESIEDPAQRAAAAVRIFGSANAGEAIKQLNAAFAESSDVVERYGLVLDSLSARQISRLSSDIKSLTAPFRQFKEDAAGLAEETKDYFEVIGGAADDMAHRVIPVINALLRTLPGVSATMGFVNGQHSLSLRDLAAGRGSSDIAARMTADDLYAQSQVAHYKQTQTLEGQQAAQSAAQKRSDDAYAALGADSAKRRENPNDNSLLTSEQRLRLATEQQSAAALATAIGNRVDALQKAADADKLAAGKAAQLAAFQAQASERLNALYQSATASEIKDPLARQIFESNVEIGRDADKTTPQEKQGRGLIELGKIQSVARAEQTKDIQQYLAAVAKTVEDDRKAFEGLLKQYDSDWTKHGEGQRKIDTGQMESARSAGEHGVKLAGAQSQPGNELQLAASVRDMRLDTVAAERAILAAHQGVYSVEQMQVETDRLAKETAAAELEYQEQITALLKERVQAAMQAGGAYQQRLKQLAQEVDALNTIKVTAGNILDIETSRKALADQVLEATVQQKLAIGDLAAGWDAFFLSMQEQAEKPGKILYDGMRAGVDGASEDIAKLAMGKGKKGDFGKTFESVGEGMVKSSAQSLIQRGLGSLGKLAGISAPGKPDGTQMNPYYVVPTGGATAPGQSGAGTTPNLGAVAPAVGAAVGASSGILAGVGNFFGKLFGRSGTPSVTSSISFMRDGGDADPGKIYGVAEAGEAELISPKNSSRITPVSKLGGGDTYHYAIDARGADLGAENRVGRAIEFAHNAAVSNAVRANSERSKRTPQRSGK